MESWICRVCGSRDLSVLPIGQYAAFFRLRVDTSKDKYLLYSKTGSIRKVRFPRPFASRVVHKVRKILRERSNTPADQLCTLMQYCAACHSITPCHEYTYEALKNLYSDYRTESYNRDRIAVEPNYAKIVDSVGAHRLELEQRNAAVDAFLRKNSNCFAGGEVIDLGGSDGRFLPPFVYEVFDSVCVFDVSDASLHASLTDRKVKKVSAMQESAYSFITCMHVLEHVGNPKAFLIDNMRYLKDGGLIYIEVPLELQESTRAEYAARLVDRTFLIHEHLNNFDRLGMAEMIRVTPGIELIDETSDVVDLGWARGVMGRYLARKTQTYTAVN